MMVTVYSLLGLQESLLERFGILHSNDSSSIETSDETAVHVMPVMNTPRQAETPQHTTCM